MNRRALLAATGTAAVGLSGCLGVIDLLSDGSYEWIHETGSRSLAVSQGRVVGLEPPSVSDGASDGDGSLYALEAETGDRLWSYGPSGPDERATSPTVRDGIYVSYAIDEAERSHETHALGFDGAVRWDDVRGSVEGIDDGVAYVTANRVDSSDRELRAVETSGGERLWRADETGPVLLDPAATGGHETVYVDGDELVALEPADGEVRWRYDHGGSGRSRAVSDGVVYVVSDGAVVAVADGDDRWRADAPTERGADREIRGVESELVLVEYADKGSDEDASAASGLRALEVDTGDERWRWERSPARRGTREPIRVAARDGVVYVGDDRLVALDAADGTVRWSDPVEADVPVGSLAVVDWAGADVDHAATVTAGGTGFAMYDPGGDRFCSDEFETDVLDVAVEELAYVATSERVYAFDAW